MPKELTWSDAEDIGILLSETHPELDPLAIRFTDLHKYVTALPDFKDDPTK
jgi:FeS assembly protein IscX